MFPYWINILDTNTLNKSKYLYPKNILCEEAKIEHISSEKKVCETDEKAIWEYRFTCFFLLYLLYSYFLYWIEELCTRL